jgi:hypothetical protein
MWETSHVLMILDIRTYNLAKNFPYAILKLIPTLTFFATLLTALTKNLRTFLY